MILFASSPVLSVPLRTFDRMGWDPWEAVGITVVEGDCEHGGVYFPDIPGILVDRGLSTVTKRTVLAHELGHHHLGHAPTNDQAVSNRQELRAQRWAAIRLITVTDLMEALRSNDNVWEVAEELGVDPELLEVRLRWLDDTEREELGLECDDE